MRHGSTRSFSLIVLSFSFFLTQTSGSKSSSWEAEEGPLFSIYLPNVPLLRSSSSCRSRAPVLPGADGLVGTAELLLTSSGIADEAQTGSRLQLQRSNAPFEGSWQHRGPTCTNQLGLERDRDHRFRVQPQFSVFKPGFSPFRLQLERSSSVRVQL